jgi:sterol-4alpha-carboxylate 3-dehydrogenase (decarboxylating)
MVTSSQTLSLVLITGGCGFIGYHLIKHILSSEPGYQIHVLDINASRNRVTNVIYHICNIVSASAVNEVVQKAKPCSIFHIACPDSMVINDKLFEDVNFQGTRNLLSSAQEVGTVKALVFTSTSSVIHDNLTDLLDVDETLPILRSPAQKRVYTQTKATAEEEILTANRAGGDASLLTCSFRPCTGIDYQVLRIEEKFDSLIHSNTELRGFVAV